MVFDDRVPRLRLDLLHPPDHIIRKQAPRPVVLLPITFPIQPAIRREVLADFRFEVDFFVQTHAVTVSVTSRTSILPVTAAVIRAVRRSLSSSIACSASQLSASSFASSWLRKAMIAD